MKFILILLFYAFFYFVFETAFNFITIDLFNPKKSKAEKMKLRASIPSSFWMLPNGSLCGIFLYLLFLIPFKMSNVFILIVVCLLGGIIITAVEFGSGYLLNIKLKLNLWDYSKSKFNYLGQIDLVHSLLWSALTYGFYVVNFLFK